MKESIITMLEELIAEMDSNRSYMLEERLYDHGINDCITVLKNKIAHIRQENEA